MQPFTYEYKGTVYDALAEHSTENGYNRYQITFDGGCVVIVPAGIPGTGGLTIWVQSNKSGEKIYPHELIQAIGDGLENSRIY